MNYSIQDGKHSADKDHTVMTGGTLSVDKTVKSEDGVTFYTYLIPMYRGVFDENFHKGIHSAEHLLAYKKDTGSVRNSLEEVSGGKISGKVILDISPYQTGVDSFGFRITSMIPLEEKQIQELTKISIQRALDFLEKGEIEHSDDFQGIPFARAISCGQFDFHDKERAVSDLKNIDLHTLLVEQKIISSKHQTAYVCDLRFLKPKLEGKDDMLMFSPDFSYKISELIETHLPKKFGGSIALVGTFGCMTGMYLCISSAIGDESDIYAIHAYIIEIIKEHISRDELSDGEKLQLDTLLENYEKYSIS